MKRWHTPEVDWDMSDEWKISLILTGWSTCVVSHTGGRMCLCDHLDGGVLVYRSPASGSNSTFTSTSLPFVWNNAVQRCKSTEFRGDCTQFGERQSSHSLFTCSFRCVCSTSRTLTCCSSVDWWWLSQWSTGTCTNGSPWGCCCSSVCVQLCKFITSGLHEQFDKTQPGLFLVTIRQ